MCTCSTTLMIIATILGPITLIFMSVSFGTDHWLEFRVNPINFTKETKDKIKTNPDFARYHVSRDRGLFRECYPGNNTEFIEKANGVVDSYCFNVDYDEPTSIVHPSDSYMSRLHLNRSFLAFFIVAIVLFAVAYIFGLILCCLRVSRFAYTAGILSFASAFFLAAAIAFFHGAEYIERNKLNKGENSYEAQFYASWQDYLKNATSRQYGWSYVLGWVGMILATLSALFYALAGCYVSSDLYEEEEILHKSRPHPHSMAPMYPVAADPHFPSYYGHPRSYLGPLSPEYYYRNYPAVGYGDPRNDMWHWKEVES